VSAHHTSSTVMIFTRVLVEGFLLLGVSVAARQVPATSDKEFALARALADATDYPDAATRKSVASELSKRNDVKLDDWLRAAKLAAMLPPKSAAEAPAPGAEPRTKPSPEHGTHLWPVELLVDGKKEKTDITVYVPFNLDASKPAPLLLACHWTSGKGSEIEPMWRATADKLGMIVLAPSEMGKNDGYGWTERERQSTLQALRWARRWYDVDENRICATGVSRGGHLVWDLALRRPDLFAAVAPMIGSPRFQLQAGQNNLRLLDNILGLSIRDLQGAQDDPLMVAILRQVFDQLAKKGATDAKLLEFADKGHDYDFGAVDWVEYFGAARRASDPERVVRAAARVDEARAFWAEITELGKEVAENVTPKVAASVWNGLDEKGKRKLLETEVEKRTARLEVKRTGPGKFAATGLRVTRFRLLLAADQFDPAQPVQVLFNGKLVSKKVVPDAKVLLQDFVERFDRTFLPVAAVDVP